MLNLYVALNGNDAWSGRLPAPAADETDGPFATLERARDEIRARKAGGFAEGVTVSLRGGKYFRAASFALEVEDSGTEEAPVVYRAYGDEEVRLIGGAEIGGFTAPDAAMLARLPAGARGGVMQVSLPALGITDYGQYLPRGHGGGWNVAALELFCNGRPMTPARWPNASPLPNHGFELVADARDDRLVYTDDRPRGWASYDGIYLHGFFSCDWASTIVRVTALDPETREIATDPPRTGHYGVRKGGRFFYFNVLEELDQPGEWHLDRAAGSLTFWPPDPLEDAEIIVSLLEAPQIELRDVEYVTFERLRIEMGRGDGIAVTGGRGVTVAGCTLCCIGKDAVVIEGGFEHTVTSCDIFETGECGVRINAGDRAKLIPCNHRVHNCHLHHIAREGWTYCGAVEIREACGAIVTHCRMHDHRHALMCFRGNDLLIEKNEFYNYTLEGDDCGCMYTGRKFDYQGNVVRFNWIHHAGDSGRNDWGSSGVYMDDGAGGTEIFGNIVHYVNKGVLAGGGLNIRIRNNIFAQCSPAVWFDERCVSARADRGETMMHGWMRQQFFGVKADEPPYQAKYPHMDAVLDALRRGVGIPPLGSCVAHNIVLGSTGPWLATHWTTFPEYFEYHDNLVDEDAGFVDPAFGLYQVRDDSDACAKIDFQRIPFEEIGLVRDIWRARIESALTALEIIEPIGADSRSGRARLIVRNVGDVPLQDTELIEIKLRRHGAGVAWVEVPYAAAPGEEVAVEFAVALPATQLQDIVELFLFSRGAQLRPVWTVMPVSYSLDTRLDLLEPVTAGATPKAGRFRLAVTNVGREAVEKTVALHVEPAGDVLLPEGDSLRFHLAPGEQGAAEFSVTLNPASARVSSRLTVTAGGEGVKPARLRAIVEYPLVRWPAMPLEAVAAVLETAPRYPVQCVPLRSAGAHLADLRFAVAGEDLVLEGEVRDEHVTVTEMLWDGSCIEVFGSSPDRERIGHVFGNILIGQLYLVPAWNGEPAKGYLQKDNARHIAPDIRVHTADTAGGYAIRALVPLKYLGVNPESDRLLFEVQVSTGFDAVTPQRRANLFGSNSAFNDTSDYALLAISDAEND